MREVKVSVCVLTYNHENYIEDCINSILSQDTTVNFEIIVGEDCSTDKTREIVYRLEEKYPELIKVIKRKENVGVMRNYSEALSLCSGEYICHFDGDDIMLPGKIEKQVKAFERYPNASIISHPMLNFNDDGVELGAPHKYETVKIFSLRDLVLKGFLFTNSSKMFRKKDIPKGGIDQSTHNCTDYLLHMESALNGDVVHLSDVLGKHRMNCGGLSQQNTERKNIENAINDQIYALDVIKSKSKDILQEEILAGKKRVYYTGCRASLRANDRNLFYMYKSYTKKIKSAHKYPLEFILYDYMTYSMLRLLFIIYKTI